MRKNVLKIAIVCLIIAISLAVYGPAYAGPECRTYGMYAENGDHYQIEFGCQLADGFLGVLSLLNNGEVMLERVYVFTVDPETEEPTVFIPKVCKLVYRDTELVYEYFDPFKKDFVNMVFKEEPE